MAGIGEAFDVVVVGSGAAGLTAALTAAVHGLSVIVLEKAAVIGGTTALSEGMVWVPCSAEARAAGIADSPEAALAYIEAVAGRHFDPVTAAAYVHGAAPMLAFIEAHAPIAYHLATGSIDYESEAPGATRGARALKPGLVDGRQLGADFPRLRSPLATTMILGGMTISGLDLPYFYRLARSPRAAAHVAGMILRHGLDRLSGSPRGTRLGNGNALVAALVLALQARDIAIRTAARVADLLVADGAVTGVAVETGGTRATIAARRGVVLACGGFPADEGRKAHHYAHVAAGRRHVRLAPAENTGDGLSLAAAAGAAIRDNLMHPAAWTPASQVPQPDGTLVPWPHYLDRAKPGIIAVDRRGRRFVNEAISYQDFVPAQIAAAAEDPEGAVVLIADRRAIRRYGLGAAPPFPGRLAPFVQSGYLVTAPTPEALADKLGIDPAGLAATLAAFNHDARAGKDTAFGRGQSAYDRANGDPEHGPNPCLGPIDTPPFYAVRVLPGDIGTFVGLRVDGSARVLDEAGRPIPGLFAAGNDVASPLGGTYPAAGITIGAAMTFGFIAGSVLAGGP